MKKMMMLALTAVMMAAGTMTVNAQEKVVTLDQLMKANQQKTQTQTAKKQTVKTAKPAKAATTTSSSAVSSGYGMVYLQYNFETMSYSKSGFSTSSSGSSITAGYSQFFGLSAGLPLYLEAGGQLKYVWNEKNDVKFNMLSLKIPVNVVYSFQVSDAISIDPFAGLYLRGNLLATEEYTKAKSDNKVNLFSKDDMGDDTWNRFQIGLQAGVRARINGQWVVGVGYSQDLSDVTDDTKCHSFDITVGMCF